MLNNNDRSMIILAILYLLFSAFCFLVFVFDEWYQGLDVTWYRLYYFAGSAVFPIGNLVWCLFSLVNIFQVAGTGVVFKGRFIHKEN